MRRTDRQLAISPAESWASEVLESDLRSFRAVSAAVRSSGFLRFESWMRLPSSAARICAVILCELAEASGQAVQAKERLVNAGGGWS